MDKDGEFYVSPEDLEAQMTADERGGGGDFIRGLFWMDFMDLPHMSLLLLTCVCVCVFPRWR